MRPEEDNSPENPPEGRIDGGRNPPDDTTIFEEGHIQGFCEDKERDSAGFLSRPSSSFSPAGSLDRPGPDLSFLGQLISGFNLGGCKIFPESLVETAVNAVDTSERFLPQFPEVFRDQPH